MKNRIHHKIACFVSIPKCASKSVLSILQLGKNRDLDHKEATERYVIYENHQRLAVLQRKYPLDSLYLFTFAANPYKRIQSWFAYHQRHPFYRKYSTFSQWIYQGCPCHWKKQNATSWHHLGKTPLLQYNFVENASHRKVDFIGKLENFEEDLRHIITHLNEICHLRKIPHTFNYRSVQKNTSNKSKCLYTPETKEKVYQMFQKDFEYFGYEK